MRYHNVHRQGFALALALIAIVIIGAIIGGVFFASTQEFRIGRNTLLQTRALTAAEYGLHQVMRRGVTDGWNRDWMLQVPVGGDPVIVAYSPDGGASQDTVRLTRLNTNSFLIVSEGLVGMAGSGANARRRIGGLVVIDPLQINVLGALTTRGTTRIGGSSHINGNDDNPTGWDCPAPTGAMPGIAIPDAADIIPTGCPGLTCVEGDPKVQQTADAAEDSTYFSFGPLSWDDLTSFADKVFGNGTVLTGLGPSLNGDMSCKIGDSKNWGDPNKLTTCGNYYPIIHATGNLKINTGFGQGILLVDGDLEVQGGFQFFGPVIVRGKLKTTGTGGHFNGGVLAANVDLDQNTVLGDAVISYSSCVLQQATAGMAIPALAAGSAWVEMF